MKPLIKGLLDNIATDGTFPINIMVLQLFGGSGETQKDRVICDFPIVLYSLASMAPNDPRIMTAYKKLESLSGESFFSCCGSIAKFKGPNCVGEMSVIAVIRNPEKIEKIIACMARQGRGLPD